MKKLSIILVVLWMILIFSFSNKPATVSSAQSDKIYNIVNKIIKINSKYSNTVVTIIRKCAHFFLYFVLGILVYNMCHYYHPKDIFILTLLICMLYACSDEIHQLFIMGRSGEIKDVCIDSLGCLLGLSICTLVNKIISRKKVRHVNN